MPPSPPTAPAPTFSGSIRTHKSADLRVFRAKAVNRAARRSGPKFASLSPDILRSCEPRHFGSQVLTSTISIIYRSLDIGEVGQIVRSANAPEFQLNVRCWTQSGPDVGVLRGAERYAVAGWTAFSELLSLAGLPSVAAIVEPLRCRWTAFSELLSLAAGSRRRTRLPLDRVF